MAVSEIKDFDLTFEFKDLDLELPDTSNLGKDERNARVEGSTGSIDFGKSSISGEFKLIKFGKYEPRSCPACALVIDFHFSSNLSCRIEEATVLCTVGSQKTDFVKTNSDDVLRPKFIRYMPKTTRDKDSTEVNLTKGFKVNPNIGVQGIVDISLGELYKDRNLIEKAYWTWQGEKLDTHSEHDTLRFQVFANTYDQDGFNKSVRTAMFLEHLNQPFYIDFKFSAKVQYSGLNVAGFFRRMIGHERSIIARRHFAPDQIGQ
ncbi:MAG: hypothetical protein ASARMPREDX12_006014 [Alectoria sarmentosa]|nr:MAG: hypothetical protein ASARMPREDX12_006014 [Alectoria sarmentosa]